MVAFGDRKDFLQFLRRGHFLRKNCKRDAACSVRRRAVVLTFQGATLRIREDGGKLLRTPCSRQAAVWSARPLQRPVLSALRRCGGLRRRWPRYHDSGLRKRGRLCALARE